MLAKILGFLLLLVSQPVLAQSVASEPYPITEGWHYRTAYSVSELRGETDGYVPLSRRISWLSTYSRLGAEVAPYLALRVSLPVKAGEYAAPTMYIPRLFFVGEVHVEDELIYRYGDLEAGTREWFRGATWHMVPLPKDWMGKPLTITVRSEYPTIGIAQPVYIGDRTDLVLHMVSKDAPAVFLSAFLFVVAILTAAVIFIVPGEVVRWLHARPGVVLVELGTAVLLLSSTAVKTLIIESDPLWNHLSITGSALLIIGALIYIRELLPGKTTQILRTVVIIHAALAGFAHIALLLNRCDVTGYLLPLRLAWYVVELIALIWVLGSTYSRHKWAFFGSVPAFLIGLIVLTAHVAWTGEFTRYYGVGTQWGLQLLTFGSLLLILRRIVHAGRVAARYRREYDTVREETQKYVYADIHDHLGGNLTDLAIRLDREGDHTTATAVRDNLQILRGRLRALEDQEMMNRDFFLGLRLMIVRRYTSAGRRVWVEVAQDGDDPSPLVPDRTSLAQFHPIVTEIITNDLKYGHGTSYWNVVVSVLEAGWYNVDIAVAAPTRYPLRKLDSESGHGTETIALRIGSLKGTILLGPEIVPGSLHTEPLRNGCLDAGDRKRIGFEIPRLPVNGDALFRFVFRVPLYSS